MLMRVWLSLICALVFVAFMALPGTIVPVHAEPGMQGNLPTPVQKLPKYPPVACVATNWETESCESRQTPLPQRNPLRAFAASRPRTVLYDEPGGDYWVHWNRFRALAVSGDDVEIRGSCASGCTLIMVHVPSDRLCFGENASLKFHVARDPKSGEPNMAFTQQRMVNQYPQDIYWWIKAKGGVEKMTIEQMWTLTAEELWAMGYRRCGPEEPPVPMTKKAAGLDLRFVGEIKATLAAGGERLWQACFAFSGGAFRACALRDMDTWPNEWSAIRDEIIRAIDARPNAWPRLAHCFAKNRTESDAACVP